MTIQLFDSNGDFVRDVDETFVGEVAEVLGVYENPWDCEFSLRDGKPIRPEIVEGSGIFAKWTDTYYVMPDWACGDGYIASLLDRERPDMREVHSTFTGRFVGEVLEKIPAELCLRVASVMWGNEGYGGVTTYVARALLDNPNCPDSVVALIYLLDPEVCDQGWCAHEAEGELIRRGFTVQRSWDYDDYTEEDLAESDMTAEQMAEEDYENDIYEARSEVRNAVNNDRSDVPENWLVFKKEN